MSGMVLGSCKNAACLSISFACFFAFSLTVLLSYSADIQMAYEKAGQPQLVLILFLKSGRNPGSCSNKTFLIKKSVTASVL